MSKRPFAIFAILFLGCSAQEEPTIAEKTYRLVDNYPAGYVAESWSVGLGDVHGELRKDGRLIATLDYLRPQRQLTLDPVDIDDPGLVTEIPGPPQLQPGFAGLNEALLMYRLSLGEPCYSCSDKICGAADGCGGTCGTGSGCCTPVCTGKVCGQPNGCGGTCGVGSGCDRLPKGNFDGLDVGSGRAWGWACDPDHPTTAISVRFQAAGIAAPLLTAAANLTSEAAVNSQCGGGTAHRFNVNLPASARGKSISALGMDVEAIANPQLTSSPRTWPADVTINIPPSDDTYVMQRSPSNTYGSVPTLSLRSVATGFGSHGYLKFNVNVPGTILSATLNVHAVAPGMDMLSVYKMVSNAWSESSLTWSTASQSISWSSLNNFVTSWTTVDVTPVTVSGPNTFGVVHGGDYTYGLHSKESAFPPYLRVTYRPN